jgi:hypothetical protein
MLAHSPPLPLVIDYNLGITEEEEEGMIIALGQRDRVRRIRLQIPVPSIQKLIPAIDEQYPMLEHLIVVPSTEDRSTVLMLPETLRAPLLRHLTLRGFVLPRGTRLLTTAVNVVTLCLFIDHPFAYFQPNTLLQWISFMPQLETLLVEFSFPVPNRDVERPPTRTPIMTSVTFPNLRSFLFRGVSAYLEAVVRRISTPCLEKLGIQFFEQLTFSVPRLLHFMNTTENLRFDSAKFEFYSDEVHVRVYPHEETETCPLSILVGCWHLDWQVSSVAQIFNSLSPIFSTVEHLTLKCEVHSRSSEEHDEVDRTEWHRLLRSFSNVKMLLVEQGLVKEISRCLRLGLDDGDLPVELLPELQKLIYSGSEDEFTSFIDTRQNAGRPVTLVYLGVGPPPDMREAIRRPYCCDTCGKIFSQLQGINRHYREKHDPRLCLFCDVEWSRPYQYRDHLKTHHPDVDPDTGIGKTAGSRRGSQVLQETRYNIKFCLRTLRVLGRAQSGILDYIRLDGARGRASRRCSLLLDCAVN